MRIRTICIWFLLMALAVPAAYARDGGLEVRLVRFAGNETYPARRLRDLMSTRPSRFLSRVRYHQQVLDEDVRNLALFYRQNGYLGASVVDVSVEIDSSAAAVDISIGIEEGELTIVEGIGI